MSSDAVAVLRVLITLALVIALIAAIAAPLDDNRGRR